MNNRPKQRVGGEIKRVGLKVRLKLFWGKRLGIVHVEAPVTKRYRLPAALREKKERRRVLGDVDLRMIARLDQSLRARQEPAAHGFSFAEHSIVDRQSETMNGTVERIEQHHAPGRKQTSHQPREGVAPGFPCFVTLAEVRHQPVPRLTGRR